MRRAATLVALAIVCLMSLLTAPHAPAESAERKVTARIAPNYPDLARRMHIHGVVKIEVVVRGNGSVKSTRVLGGNPVLVDAATEAVAKWKFEPAQNDTTEVVQLTFDPQ